MNGYEENTESVDVPKGAGIEGFLYAVRQMLRLPRVQNISIDSRGRVSAVYYARAGEEKKAVAFDFEALMPYATIRNGEVVEVLPKSDNATHVIAEVFERATVDQLYPLSFVLGANSQLWRWYEQSVGLRHENRDQFFGLPVVTDRHVDDAVVLFCAGYTRAAPLAETRKTYKFLIPRVVTA